jgi:hypothetical protein
MSYNMQRQLARGEEAERLLDAHFADRFAITPATRDQQRRGIDRIFRHRQSSKEYLIEYKTDWTAAQTNNAFIETISVDTMGIPGWAYTSTAEWLIYYVPGKQIIYDVRFSKLRAQIDEWVERFGPEKAIPNDGYFTRGVPVPLDVFKGCSSKIERISAIDTGYAER